MGVGKSRVWVDKEAVFPADTIRGTVHKDRMEPGKTEGTWGSLGVEGHQGNTSPAEDRGESRAEV